MNKLEIQFTHGNRGVENLMDYPLHPYFFPGVYLDGFLNDELMPDLFDSLDDAIVRELEVQDLVEEITDEDVTYIHECLFDSEGIGYIVFESDRTYVGAVYFPEKVLRLINLLTPDKAFLPNYFVLNDYKRWQGVYRND